MHSSFHQGFATIAFLLFCIALISKSTLLLFIAVGLMVFPIGRHLALRVRNGDMANVLLIFVILAFIGFVVYEVFDF
ncbi:hypothetical protein MM326_02795 [Alkalihalobacillus sp. LMS6]|uniref:hypothetical protein n=1 Tax=Alkalihalobacillus sp. LMS6 TaxID=2924034 RepID=UPI0020D09E3B|nr:hypothetical protein [Alkalihalobacillus sp. LMS6]UTR06977.1 hypothetical protein MM326_02795 [Alkalihalobacillus sp. LMS6]